MRGEKLLDYLQGNDIPFQIIHHPVAFSSSKIAHLAHVHGKEMAKPVILKIQGRLCMVVIPANRKVNLTRIKALFGTQDVELAAESEFVKRFPDCDMGAMPPFGNLYGMDEIISDELSQDDEIVFNAGTHTELIKMKYRDFESLVHPKIVNFRPTA